MEPDDKGKRFERQTKEHFEILGRFVQSFEHMVNAARGGCLLLTSPTPHYQRLVGMAFYHPAMTAQPLFEVWRGVIAEIRPPAPLSDETPEAKEEKVAANAILKYMAGEYSDLVRERNAIVHGTWHIGWNGSAEADSSALNLFKMNITKSGLVQADTPKDTEAMFRLISRLDALTLMIHRVTAAIIINRRLGPNFVREGNGWRVPGQLVEVVE